MKKISCLLALAAPFAFAQAPTGVPARIDGKTPAQSGIIQNDAQSRVDRLNRNLPALEQGDASALTRVSAVLQANIPAVIEELRNAPQHTNGRALALWAKSIWTQENLLPIARIYVQLALGGDLQTEAGRYFKEGENFAHARALGYYLGALHSALLAAEPDEKQRAARLAAFAQKAAEYAGVSDLRSAMPAEPSARQRWAHEYLKREQPAENALLQLAIPPEAQNDDAYKAAFEALQHAWQATHNALQTP